MSFPRGEEEKDWLAVIFVVNYLPAQPASQLRFYKFFFSHRDRETERQRDRETERPLLDTLRASCSIIDKVGLSLSHSPTPVSLDVYRYITSTLHPLQSKLCKIYDIKSYDIL